MRKLLLVALASVAFIATSAAQAADLRAKPRYRAPVIASHWNWTGFYMGGNVGYSWGRSSTDISVLDTNGSTLAFAPTSAKLNGAIGGFQVGYNVQVNRIVWGVETDIQASGQKGDTSFVCAAVISDSPVIRPVVIVIPTAPVTTTVNQELPWFGTLRGRLGITGSPIMYYVTGGLAYGELKSDGTVVGLNAVGAGTSTAFSSHTTRAGW